MIALTGKFHKPQSPFFGVSTKSNDAIDLLWPQQNKVEIGVLAEKGHTVSSSSASACLTVPPRLKGSAPPSPKNSQNLYHYTKVTDWRHNVASPVRFVLLPPLCQSTFTICTIPDKYILYIDICVYVCVCIYIFLSQSAFYCAVLRNLQRLLSLLLCVCVCVLLQIIVLSVVFAFCCVYLLLIKRSLPK